MIQLKQPGLQSWFNNEYARCLSRRLSERLWKRCHGERGLFVTLTYRRDEYANAKDLYRKQSEEQHVPLFLRKISRLLDVDLKGRWFCKLEFQRGGWVHWHIIILGVERIPHADCQRLWGRGHVWLKKLNQRNVRYCTKYFAKPGSLPPWLYLEAARSVKVVRVSPGFWCDEDEDAIDDEDDAPEIDRSCFVKGRSVPIGYRLEEEASVFVARDMNGGYARGRADLGELLMELINNGCQVVGGRQGWITLDASWDNLGEALCSINGRTSAANAAGVRLHLKGTSIPDAGPKLPRVLHNFLLSDALESDDDLTEAFFESLPDVTHGRAELPRRGAVSTSARSAFVSRGEDRGRHVAG